MRHLVFLFALLCSLPTFAQQQDLASEPDQVQADAPNEPTVDADTMVTPPAKVEVTQRAEDEQIHDRVIRILQLTKWYTELRVDVKEGVVFLAGSAKREEHRRWAEDLAKNTQDVVAVVNRITMEPRPFWDMSGVESELTSLARQSVQFLPLLAIAMLVIALSWSFSGMMARWSKAVFHRKIRSVLLADVASRVVAIVVLIVGFYIALRISGLTQLAATLLGGTGLLGLVIGIAFRDIAENFLASLLISVQRPFALGDLIEVTGSTGYVQSVTMRGTLLLMLDGNHIQIPNSIVYKSTIKNMTANPRMRLEFDIAIERADSVNVMQEAILSVVKNHEAVLKDPEPMVLAESVTATHVNLRTYIWIDGVKHSAIKVRSALIRLSTRAILDAKQNNAKLSSAQPLSTEITRGLPDASSTNHAEPECSTSEGNLSNDSSRLKNQAKHSRVPEQGTNLIADDQDSLQPSKASSS